MPSGSPADSSTSTRSKAPFFKIDQQPRCAQNGRVLDQKQGEVDILELRRVILANPPAPDYIGHRAYWASK
ncbi:MAG: hypothetical protein NT090_00860 [Acidobacteria bacterium]|nr:hypothetical protein [Acidobacteriota bacterium]